MVGEPDPVDTGGETAAEADAKLAALIKPAASGTRREGRARGHGYERRRARSATTTEHGQGGRARGRAHAVPLSTSRAARPRPQRGDRVHRSRSSSAGTSPTRSSRGCARRCSTSGTSTATRSSTAPATSDDLRRPRARRGGHELGPPKMIYTGLTQPFWVDMSIGAVGRHLRRVAVHLLSAVEVHRARPLQARAPDHASRSRCSRAVFFVCGALFCFYFALPTAATSSCWLQHAQSAVDAEHARSTST